MVEPSLSIDCPVCGGPATVQSVQGDRCPGCGFEFKRFAPDEGRLAADYYQVLTGEKRLLEVPGKAWVVAHE